MEKEWQILNKDDPQDVDDIFQVLLENRGLEKGEDIQDFLNPRLPAELVDNPSLVGLDETSLEKAVEIIQEAVDQQRLIVIHGDYDVDGLCATAVLWEVLYKDLGYKNILPFVPNRFEHGYGLSIDSIDALSRQVENQQPFLITVDCGITAKDEIEYANAKGFEVLVTDHHQKLGELPDAEDIVWSDQICGAGISWMLSQRLSLESQSRKGPTYNKVQPSTRLDLVAIATLCDLEPLLGPNRSLVKYGLNELNANTREGIKALQEVAGLRGKEIGTYEVGWILGPRLNAAGRLADATDALRLLCTREAEAAQVLAGRLNALNRERQTITKDAVEIAKKDLISDLVDLPPFIVLDHEDYHEGVIGLVAGDLVKNFNRPSIAISRGKDVSKGSARSVEGFNIIAALRGCEDCLVDVGGHPMAAGFTIETNRIVEFRKKLLAYGKENIDQSMFKPVLKVDCKISTNLVGPKLWKRLKQFEPFGVGNPRPKFLIENVEVQSLRSVGSDNKHLKMRLGSSSDQILSAIAFNFGHWKMRLLSGDRVDVVASIQLNKWNGKEAVELQVRDLRKSVLDYS